MVIGLNPPFGKDSALANQVQLKRQHLIKQRSSGRSHQSALQCLCMVMLLSSNLPAECFCMMVLQFVVHAAKEFDPRVIVLIAPPNTVTPKGYRVGVSCTAILLDNPVVWLETTCVTAFVDMPPGTSKTQAALDIQSARKASFSWC